MTHIFTLNNATLLFDTESGALHRIDDDTRRVLALVQAPMTPDCPDAVLAQAGEEGREIWRQLYQLQQDGQLFTPEQRVLQKAPTGVIKAMCLHVAHDCNLRCDYCFAGTGAFGAGRGLMDAQTARDAVDFLLAHSANRKHLEIDFFGGEPLMAWDTVTGTVDYARQRAAATNKVFRFTLTTNGLLLDDDKIAYINANMDNVVLSIDGRASSHDAVRRTVSGAPSHALVLPKFQKLIASRTKDYYARATFTARSLDFAQDVLALADAGFKHISVEPVVLSADHPLAIGPQHLEAVNAEYERLLQLLRDRPNINFFHFRIDLNQGPCVYKRVKGCGAGVEYVAITPEREIYPCHQFVGRAAYRLGTLDSTDWRDDISEHFASLNLYSRDACTQCWARYLCGGGCAAANLTANNDLSQPYEIGCQLAKKRFECAMIKAAQHN